MRLRLNAGMPPVFYQQPTFGVGVGGGNPLQQQTRAVHGCMAAGQSPCLQAWAVAYVERRQAPSFLPTPLTFMRGVGGVHRYSSRLGLCMAVRLRAKARACGLGLWPTVNAGTPHGHHYSSRLKLRASVRENWCLGPTHSGHPFPLRG